MNILIPISIVPDIYTKVLIDSFDDALIVPQDSMMLNPIDVQVLSKALDLRTDRDIHITVVSVCDTNSPILAMTYALGADKVVRIDSTSKDAYSTAHSIAQLVKSEEYDVIMCGAFSWDFATGQVPRYLAQELHLPLYENVADIELRGKKVEFTTQSEYKISRFEIDQPVILSCNKSIFPEKEVKIPSLRQMMSAKNKVQHIFSVDQFDPMQTFYEFNYTPQRAKVRMFCENELNELVEIILAANDTKVELIDGYKNIFSGSIRAKVKGDNLNYQSSDGAALLSEKVLRPHISFETSNVIISGGAGVSLSSWDLIDEFADRLHIATACTRPVYDSGRRPYYQHVGQTGAKVAPQLYIAVGISGALQHIAGVIKSHKILAINSDLDAPIFKNADYGVLGDAHKILSEILKIISKLPPRSPN